MSIPTVVDNVTSVNATLLNAYKSEIEALQGRSVLAGTGLAGGGTLAADRTLSLDIAGLTALGVAVDQTADLLPIYDASGAVIRKVSAAALLPLTTKGDLLTHNGTAPERLAISTDGHVLTCQADGSANWEALPASGEPPLGNPAVSGQVLASTDAGVRSWTSLPSPGFWERVDIPACIQGQINWTQTTGTWGTASSAVDNALYLRIYNQPHNLNDAITKSNVRVPTTGTYSLIFQTTRDAATGIISVYVDGVSKGSYDTYAASAEHGIWSDPISLGALTKNTAYAIKFQVTGKNTSSTDHYFNFHRAIIFRTA